jgi:regulator of replication initiation timing
VETSFKDITDFISQIASQKWAGGTGVSLILYMAYLFWNNWRTGNIKIMEIEVGERQKREEQEVSDFRATIEAQNSIVANLRESLSSAQENLKAAYLENDTLRKIFSSDRDQWAKERKSRDDRIADLEEKNGILIRTNAGLIADNHALRHQLEQALIENLALKQVQQPIG